MTALSILKRALRMLGVYSTGETPSAEETADGVEALNALLGTISNTGLVYTKTEDVISVPSNTTSITVGPSGGTITARPISVLDDSYFVISGVSYPLTVATDQQYNAVGIKAMTGLPAAIWPKMGMDNVTITFWPIPTQAITLHLWSTKVIGSATSATTDLSMPPGYDDALAYLLAEAIAPEYSKEPPPSVMRGAMRARKVLKRTNYQVPTLSLPDSISGHGFVDIRQFGQQ